VIAGLFGKRSFRTKQGLGADDDLENIFPAFWLREIPTKKT